MVLMDVRMPGVDGYEAVHQIRAWEADQGRVPMPIVALTAQAYQDDVRRALASGFQAHLAKPVDRSQLKAVIRRWALPAGDSETLPKEFESWRQRYLGEVRQFVAQGLQALKTENWYDIAAIGHKLKGSGAVFGYPSLGTLGSGLEAAAAAADVETSQDLLAKLTTFIETEEAQP